MIRDKIKFQVYKFDKKYIEYHNSQGLKYYSVVSGLYFDDNGKPKIFEEYYFDVDNFEYIQNKYNYDFLEETYFEKFGEELIIEMKSNKKKKKKRGR